MLKDQKLQSENETTILENFDKFSKHYTLAYNLTRKLSRPEFKDFEKRKKIIIINFKKNADKKS